MTDNQERRLKARDLAAEERKVARMEPATFNYMHALPQWMQYDPIFNAIWDEVKTWDVNVPTEYSGYCMATGGHAGAILAAIIDKGLYRPKQVGSLVPELPDIRA